MEYRNLKKIKLTLFSIAIASLFSGCSIGFGGSNVISKARYKATMKPYIRRGELIEPKEVSVNQTQMGIASWYGPNFHGGITSSGERYNMYSYTAAHKTFPLGTIVKVENLKNGKSVYVRINDRGPFIKGRIIDCSYAAACKIGLDKDGVAPVRVTVVNKIRPRG